MGKQLQLSIDDPCHENWDKMTAAEQGRYCGSCQKQVVDFTSMTDAQLATYFKKPSTGSVCGRFYDDQLNRHIQVPKKAIPWIKYFFQIALPAFLMSAKASAQGKVMVKRTEMTASLRSTGFVGVAYEPVKKRTKQAHNLTTEISLTGKITNEKGEGIPYASVLVKGGRYGAPADSNGVFTVERIMYDTDIILDVSSVGYQSREVVIKPTDLVKGLVIQLTSVAMPEVVVTSYVSTMMGAIRLGGISVSRRTEKSVPDSIIIKSPAEKPAMIKVYPNPVLSGTAINIGCEKLEEGYYSFQLFNQSGQQIETKQVWIDAEARIMNMEIPSVAAGSYILTLTHKESGKRFSEKIIVQ
jgi:hypothetical protein